MPRFLVQRVMCFEIFNWKNIGKYRKYRFQSQLLASRIRSAGCSLLYVEWTNSENSCREVSSRLQLNNLAYAGTTRVSRVYPLVCILYVYFPVHIFRIHAKPPLPFDPWKSLKIYNIHVSEKQRWKTSLSSVLILPSGSYFSSSVARARPANVGTTRARKKLRSIERANKTAPDVIRLLN